jgi:hypothetical protein
MVSRIRHSPVYAGLVVAFLALQQGAAMVRQWQEGYRPFVRAPQRVPLSWDMFAVEIERCELSWDQPVYWLGRPMRRLRDLGSALEWDPVYNRRSDYIAAGISACEDRGPGLSGPAGGFHVHCFGPGAKETTDAFDCPRF